MRATLATALVLTILAALAAGPAFAQKTARQLAQPQAAQPPALSALAHEAVSPDPDRAAFAVTRLRAAGPEGLAALLTAHADAVARHGEGPRKPEDPAAARWERLRAALTAVGGQRDCHVSRLYWYTDLERARRTAERSGKPILSLRMLGNLTDEYSCANSRFFRSTLYANREVSAYLREHFVLHWKSVRPVPVITIDFGDGRVIKRTITGNSAHYVLDASGRPLDALPGLYGPSAFLDWLQRSASLAGGLRDLDEASRAETLVRYHRRRLDDISGAWYADLERVAPGVVTEAKRAAGVDGQPEGKANAAEAARRAITKSVVEVPVLAAITPDRLSELTGEELWRKIAALHADEARLDDASVRLIRRENPSAVDASRLARTKAIVEDPLVRLVRNLESSIALDTVRNEYLLHRQIHEWIVTGTPLDDVERLNERVYAELFVTPSSDPWLGLVPPNTYTALDDGGLVTE